MADVLGRDSASPAPPPDPSPDLLNLDQVRQLIEPGDPEGWYVRAAAFDRVMTRLHEMSDAAHGSVNDTDGAWTGAAQEAYANKFQNVRATMDQMLQAPDYGGLLRRAGDALANGKRRLNDIVLQRDQQSGADPAVFDEQARQVFTDLAAAYEDVGQAIAGGPDTLTYVPAPSVSISWASDGEQSANNEASGYAGERPIGEGTGHDASSRPWLFGAGFPGAAAMGFGPATVDPAAAGMWPVAPRQAPDAQIVPAEAQAEGASNEWLPMAFANSFADPWSPIGRPGDRRGPAQFRRAEGDEESVEEAATEFAAACPVDVGAGDGEPATDGEGADVVTASAAAEASAADPAHAEDLAQSPTATERSAPSAVPTTTVDVLTAATTTAAAVTTGLATTATATPAAAPSPAIAAAPASPAAIASPAPAAPAIPASATAAPSTPAASSSTTGLTPPMPSGGIPTEVASPTGTGGSPGGVQPASTGRTHMPFAPAPGPDLARGSATLAGVMDPTGALGPAAGTAGGATHGVMAGGGAMGGGISPAAVGGYRAGGTKSGPVPQPDDEPASWDAEEHPFPVIGRRRRAVDPNEGSDPDPDQPAGPIGRLSQFLGDMSREGDQDG